MLARQPIILNVAQRRDALDLLCSLPDACTPSVFFDPQHRAVLDRLKFGNEGAHQRGRADLPPMTEHPTLVTTELAIWKLRSQNRKTWSAQCRSSNAAMKSLN